jgi:hypothetical protein
VKLTDIVHQIGDRVRLAARVTGLTGGTSAIDSIVVTAAGSGYTSTPTVAFSGGGGSGAAATAVMFNDTVLGITVTNPGTGFTSVPAVVFSGGGGGSGAAATAVLLALDLDAIPTANISLAQSLWISPIVGGEILLYRLRAGTDAEVSPVVIRPDDYFAVTNEKVWDLAAVKTRRRVCPTKTLAYAATVDLDFSAGERQQVDLTGNVTFTTSNRGDGKRIVLKVKCDGTLRTFTFPGWIFVRAAAPASVAANKTALLKLEGFGSTDALVVADYAVEP